MTARKSLHPRVVYLSIVETFWFKSIGLLGRVALCADKNFRRMWGDGTSLGEALGHHRIQFIAHPLHASIGCVLYNLKGAGATKSSAVEIHSSPNGISPLHESSPNIDSMCQKEPEKEKRNRPPPHRGVHSELN